MMHLYILKKEKYCISKSKLIVLLLRNNKNDDCASVLKIFMKKIIVFFLVLCMRHVADGQQIDANIAEPPLIEDKGFWQEYHEAYPISNTPAENNVRSIVVDKKLTAWIATEAGIFSKKNDETKWLRSE